jgi:hypothetical protein
MVVELGTWKQERLDTGVSISGTAMSHDGRFYFLKQAKNGATDLVRADLATGEREVVHRLKDLKIRSLGTVPNHGRYYAGGTKTEPGWKMFDVGLIDLQSGEERILDRDPFILNPHPQFEPGEGRMLMIQHNRGGTYSQDGKLERLVGPEGATLYTLSVTKGKRTELLVGKPYTTPCTGHEAWIGTSQEMILSVAASGDFAPEKGNLLGIPTGPGRIASSLAGTASIIVVPAGADDISGRTIGNLLTRSWSAQPQSRNQRWCAHPRRNPTAARTRTHTPT